MPPVAGAQAPRTRSGSSDPIISVHELHKEYDGREVVAGVDFDVHPGEIFAFLGPNGAGKTTTVEILEGYRERSAGDVSVLGVDPARPTRSWHHRVGVVLQESQPEPELTARECLQLYAGYYADALPVETTLDAVGLLPEADVLVRALSGGQRRRLDFGLALVGNPELLFLDEPTTGFDPSSRRAAWSVISSLRSLGKTIFLTTHYMDEAEALADRIAVIAEGRIIAAGTPKTLGGRESKQCRVTFTLPAGAGMGDLPAALPGSITMPGDGRVEIRAGEPMRLLAALSAWAVARGYDLTDIEVRRPSLEDIYLELTGGGS